MRGRTARAARRWARDMVLGALIFVVVPVLAHGLGAPGERWPIAEAVAAEVLATRAVEVSAPAGTVAENAIVAAAQLNPAQAPLMARRLVEMALLGVTFSLLVALNLAFWRHLRRVSASPRRSEWRRRA